MSYPNRSSQAKKEKRRKNSDEKFLKLSILETIISRHFLQLSRAYYIDKEKIKKKEKNKIVTRNIQLSFPNRPGYAKERKRRKKRRKKKTEQQQNQRS